MSSICVQGNRLRMGLFTPPCERKLAVPYRLFALEFVTYTSYRSKWSCIMITGSNTTLAV